MLDKEKPQTRLEYLEGESDKSKIEELHKKWWSQGDIMVKLMEQAAKFSDKGGMPSTISEIMSVYQTYKSTISQLRDTNQETLSKMVHHYFEPQEKVLRLMLLRDRINPSRRKGEVTLLAYYINLKPDEKNANMINMDQPGRNKEERSATAKFEIEIFEKNQAIKQRQESEEELKEFQKAEEKKSVQIYKAVFGKKFDEEKGLVLKDRPDYTQPKNKYRVRTNLMELAKDFRHETVVQNMLKDELADNQLFKYPEEYMMYDAKETKIKKTLATDKDNYDGLKEEDFEKQQNNLDAFDRYDRINYQDDLRDHRKMKEELKDLEKWIQEQAIEYHEWMRRRNKKDRSKEDRVTLRKKVSDIYKAMINLNDLGRLAK